MTSTPRYQYGLSKSRFVSGVQCHNKLWLEVHEPDADELRLTPAVVDLLEQGQQVGRLARDRFPGGELVDASSETVEDRLIATRVALDRGVSTLFEAAFSADGVFVAVDVLERHGAGFCLIEVKSATSLKDEHVPDVALQTHVLRANGLDVHRVEIMHLNKEYRHPDVGDFFVREDVTDRVHEFLARVPREIESQLAMLRNDYPALPVGEQCANIRDCPFRRRCWPDDSDHVLKLNGKGVRKALELMADGIHRIQDIPPHVRLSAVNLRQKTALERGGLAVEPGLKDVLDGIERPVGFLDFETVARAVPVWHGLPPWGAVPVQFSYHEEREDGGYAHAEWLADGPEDPRENMTRTLIEVCRGAGHIVVYTGFESRQLRNLKESLPFYASELDSIDQRLFDLHRTVKDFVYHPDFDGSFSIKAVLPVLVPELGYDDLEIAEGLTASAEIARLMLRPETFASGERERLRKNLLAYCERDTWAMVRLLERLRTIASVAG